ncbi:MAG: hypothetical protein IH998_10200 [Proteobacteria bacterium]|nr:hypothetical protein [Pseudomonadota bacterium]
MLTDGAIRALAEAGEGGPASLHPPRPEPLASVLPWRILRTAMRNPIAAWPPVLFEGTSWRPPFPGAPVFLTDPAAVRAAMVERAEDFRHGDLWRRVMHPAWGEIIIGRQAIGLGRGVLFGAVDMFSTFGTVEVDREWRRGIDALRFEYRLSDTSSVELIAVFGRSRDDSALLGRLRGFIGNIDAELIIGKRARDNVFAGILSGNLGDAEVHLELAVFNTPESQPDGGIFGKDDLVGKAVFGGSYTFDVGRGLTVFAEYHYSGFGVKDLSDALARLLDRAFQERLLRGDMQILGRHALAIQLSYQLTDTLSTGFMVLESPTDGSGLASTSLIWSHAENATLSTSLLLPWGASPRRGRLESEYGASPISLFAQWTLYF